MKTLTNRSAILLIYCNDQKGLVASITEFIAKNNGNILSLDQHVDSEQKIFFMRIEWDLENFIIPPEKIGEFFKVLIADRLKMKWKLYFSDEIPKMALFVSKQGHCLSDIIARYQAGEWNVHIPLVISNHETFADVAEQAGIDFHYTPVTKENKAEQEKKQLLLLKNYDIDFVVLARYMQILSSDFVKTYENRIINIHHSFLPAFPGAKPYHSAYQRGVKVIGATSHYVTKDLDAGPIIEQDVVRIRHTDSVEDLVRKGRDLEKIVLARAIWFHLQRKILAYANRTVIFN
jgi:formyltetrahydrofolate deformylase